jgi:hypothetical protein
MASRQPISVAGLLIILYGAVFVATGLYQPMNPDFCVDGCGIVGNALSDLMGVVNSITGQWGPRLIYISAGVCLIVVGWRDRFRGKQGKKEDAV